MSEQEWMDAAQAFINSEFNENDDLTQTLPVEPAEAPVEPDTPELNIDATGRAHGADGKFVSNKAEETEEEEAPELATAPDEPEAAAEEADQEASEEDDFVFEYDDPDIEAYLNKYQGDPIKALKAAVEAQGLIGRQGAELADLRAISQQIQDLQYAMTPYGADIEENPEAVVQEVLQRAMQTGQFDDATYNAAMREWGESDPFEAAKLHQTVQLARWQAEQIVQSRMQEESTVGTEFAALKERHPDIEKHLPAIEKLVSERPHWQNLISSGNPKDRAQAFEDLYLLARGQSDASDTPAAVRKMVLKAKVEADTAKQEAAVVSASNTGVNEGAKKPNEFLTETLVNLTGLEDLTIE